MERREQSPQLAQDSLLAPRFGRKGTVTTTSARSTLGSEVWKEGTVTTTSGRSTLGSEVWKEGDGHHNKRKIHSWLRGLEGRGRSPQLAQDPLLAPRFGRKGTVTTTSARSTLGSEVWKEGDGHHNKRKIHSWLRGLEGRGRSPQQAQDPLLAPRFGRKGRSPQQAQDPLLAPRFGRKGTVTPLQLRKIQNVHQTPIDIPGECPVQGFLVGLSAAVLSALGVL